MTLSFPNQSRSYDARRKLVRFWGYDSALEISFFVEVNALHKLDSRMSATELAYLTTFDAHRDQIHEAARNAYSRGFKDAYLLSPDHF